MVEDQNSSNEVVHSDNDSKTMYHYVDQTKRLDLLSKEVYKKEDKTTYYPFYINKENEIKQKYRKIQSITYEGFKNSLPGGFIKSYTRGYGFTKQLKPLINFVESNLEVQNIMVSKKRKTEINATAFIVNFKDLEKIRKYISAELRKCSENNKVNVNNFFALLLPSTFEQIRKTYQRGLICNILQEYDNLSNNLSADDKEALLNLFEKLSLNKKELFEKRTLKKTKETIDQIYIEDVLREFERLLGLKRVKEEVWQDFFKSNSWIFSQLFAYPTVLLKDKAYVGGKTIDNKEGKIVDFLYKNKLTKNSALIEIKTHKSRIMSKKPYRGSDVFHLDKELSGAINQILDQKDTYGKQFNSVHQGGDYETFNPKCVIIIGLISDFDKKQLKSFELFRNSSKDIEIIAFDELYERIKSIVSIFKKDKDETETKTN